ncbi:LIC_10190 family membrane protein [Empedobacter sedimenti]|uniref:LIC_10190 family membrane protein n=1 Tax=Empedobacter sedimenti TaxID=3042610 RepID=UPI0024A63038|nr:hypothetical protein [Empedobacter sedimenti]
MVYQLIFSIVLLFYFYSFGLLFNKIIPKLNHYYSLTILNGMIGVGLLSFVVAFLFPLNKTYEIVLILLSLFGLAVYRKSAINFLKFFKELPWFFYCILLAGLVFTVTYPYILDHFGYYVPTIKWLDFAGYVKGLSNLEWVLVQNSFWHVLQASVNEVLDHYYRLNFVLFIVFNLYLVESKSTRLLPFNLIFLFFLNAPSPDFPVMALSIILLNEYLKSTNKVSDYLFYAAIVFIIKPISILLIVFFLIEYFKRKEYKDLKDKNILLIISLAIFFCLKGIVLSGNPLFPLVNTSIEELSWASPKSMYFVSENSGKFIPLKELFTSDEVSRMSKLEYYQNVFLGNALRSKILLVITLFTLGLLIYSIIHYKKNSTRFWLMLAVVIKVVFILFTSPQFRFLLDVFVIDSFIILLFFKKELFNSKWVFSNFSFVCLLVVGLVFPNLWVKHLNGISTFSFLSKFESKFLLKPGQYDLTYKTGQIGNFKYNFPENYPLIYSVKVPAISLATLNWYYINEGYVQQIDPNNVKKGFYWKKMTEEEKKNLERIIIEEQKKQVK